MFTPEETTSAAEELSGKLLELSGKLSELASGLNNIQERGQEIATRLDQHRSDVHSAMEEVSQFAQQESDFLHGLHERFDRIWTEFQELKQLIQSEPPESGQ